MPRLVLRKKKLSTAEKVRRARFQRPARTFVFVDPFPNVYGTKPEKMVYAELVQRKIPFIFQEWLHLGIEGLESNDWYRPDFQLPQYKMVIEVQGAYWHTQPDQLEKDSLKYALYKMAGWKVLLWWDYDIYTKLDELFDSVPELRTPTVVGAPIPRTSKWYDDAAAIRSANKKRVIKNYWKRKPVKYKVKGRRKNARRTIINISN